MLHILDRASSPVVIVTVAIVALACRGGESEQAEAGLSEAGWFAESARVVMPSIRTENGIRILEHDRDAFDRAPRLWIDAQPLASLGGADEEFDLTHAQDFVLLPDERIATLAPVGSRLLIFRANGRGERQIGREGKAPGEFMAADGMIAWHADTLFVPDPANRRMNWVHPDDGVVSSRPYKPTEDFYFIRPAGVLPDGRIVVHSAGLMHEGVRDSIVRPPTPIALLEPSTGLIEQVASIPDVETVMIETRYRGRRAFESTALHHGLRAQVVVWDTLIASASSPAYEIERRDSRGAIVSRLRVDRPRRPVTQEMRDAYIARVLERFENGGSEGWVDPAESRRIVEATPFADSMPPHGPVFATRGGLLWVSDVSAAGDASRWATAFRTDGAIVARLELPRDAFPVAFGDDRVLLRAEDENDVVTLRVHRLRSGGP